MISLVKRLLDITGKRKKTIYAAFAFSFVKALLSKAPVIITLAAIYTFYNGTMDLKLCVRFGVVMALCLVLQAIAQAMADQLQSTVGYRIFAEKRMELGEHLRRLPMGYFTEGNIGKISSILSTDMVFVEGYCMTELANMVSYIFAEAVLLIFLFFFNFWLGFTTILLLCVIWTVAAAMRKISLKDSAQKQEQSQKLTESVLEFVSGIGIIKTYNIIGKKQADLINNFKQTCDFSLDYERSQTLWQRRLFMIYGIGTAAIIALALILESYGIMDKMFVIGILLLAFDLFAPVKALYSSIPLLAIMNSCMDRIDAVFDEPELPDIGNRVIPSKSNLPEIQFSNVGFGYGEKEILHNISFELHDCQMTALVGPSGSGKSTITNLLARFWDVNSGHIYIRGVDIMQIPFAELMNHISMVFQRVYLFSDTIYNNICIGRPDANYEDVIDAAKKARCYDFIRALPDGFDTIVGESGYSLSGGEKQRISIARCILKDAPIVILDEATASVDADNESYIQEAISELCNGKTLLVIAHRLGTIRNANEILVLSDGVIKERGSHEALLMKKGIYTDFVNIRERSRG
ncbi:MAG: ABC transporter ATP-binding protein [Lachnospiraceae bacterium]